MNRNLLSLLFLVLTCAFVVMGLKTSNVFAAFMLFFLGMYSAFLMIGSGRSNKCTNAT